MLGNFLYGSSYEIGLQHGKSVRTLIWAAVRDFKRFRHTEQDVPFQLVNKKLNTLRKVCPDLIKEMQGIADGAQISFEDIARLNLRPFFNQCSNLVFLKTEEGSILGHTNDSLVATYDIIHTLHYKKTSNNIFHIGLVGTVWTSAGINESGLVVGHSATRSKGIKSKESNLNLPLIRRLLLQKCRTVKEAIRFLKRYTYTSGGDNIILLDVKGEACVVEKLPTDMYVRNIDKLPGLYCTGLFTNRRMQKLVAQDKHIKEKEDQEVLKRHRYFEQLLNKYQKHLTVDLLKEALRQHNPEGNICNDSTSWAAIFFPKHRMVSLSDGPPCHHKFISYRLPRHGQSKYEKVILKLTETLSGLNIVEGLAVSGSAIHNKLKKNSDLDILICDPNLPFHKDGKPPTQRYGLPTKIKGIKLHIFADSPLASREYLKRGTPACVKMFADAQILFDRFGKMATLIHLAKNVISK